jgi:hypothetical protein
MLARGFGFTEHLQHGKAFYSLHGSTNGPDSSMK